MGAELKIIGLPRIASAMGVSVSTLRNWRQRYGTDRYIYRTAGRWTTTEREMNALWDYLKEQK